MCKYSHGVSVNLVSEHVNTITEQGQSGCTCKKIEPIITKQAVELLFFFISPLVFPHPTALTSKLSSFSFAVTFSLYSDLCCNLPDETCQPDLFLKCTTSFFYSFFCGFKASCVLLLCCLLCTSPLFSASGCLSSVGVYVLTLAAWSYAGTCWFYQQHLGNAAEYYSPRLIYL